ncbi:hypothetical protein SAMN04487950_2126 [Halogranum rubrum]|uniref:DUF5518 domain-containing protein n=1 Tax=Halogranum rubrum TaxID=553466 RepID=A0A1I4EEM6_9EURY|nr:DUF5518 domain-containing protein [Halogranum rubrum]SFL04185.1 hypothetical protein SAMN04487950_2126 [Halogranum rubrum]
MVNWRAVAYGMVTAFVVGIISGLGLPFTDATLPVVGAGFSGLIAGGVAGYYSHEGMGGGALHGLLATTIGGIIVGLVLIVLGTLAAGLGGFGLAVGFLLLIVASGLPGAVGGAVGAMFRGEEEPMGRPAA